VLGQGDGPASSPELVNFINPAIDAACNLFNQPNASPSPLIYNLTGYSFVKLNIDLLAPNLAEYQQAFSSIVRYMKSAHSCSLEEYTN